MAQDVLDGIFIFDVCVQFLSGYYDSGGKRFPVRAVHPSVAARTRTAA